MCNTLRRARRSSLDRQIRAGYKAIPKRLHTSDFAAIPGLKKMLVRELTWCAFIERHENVIALGDSGTGKTHLALALRLAACQRGFSTLFMFGSCARPSAYGGS